MSVALITTIRSTRHSLTTYKPYSLFYHLLYLGRRDLFLGFSPVRLYIYLILRITIDLAMGFAT